MIDQTMIAGMNIGFGFAVGVAMACGLLAAGMLIVDAAFAAIRSGLRWALRRWAAQ